MICDIAETYSPVSNWELPAASWPCSFQSKDGVVCAKIYRDRRSLRRHVNMIHEMDIDSSEVPRLFRPSVEAMKVRLEMLRRNSGRSQIKNKEKKEQVGEVTVVTKKKAKKAKLSDTVAVKTDAKEEASVVLSLTEGACGSKQTDMRQPPSVQSLKDLNTPALMFSPMSVGPSFFTPKSTSELIKSLCGLADDVLEAPTVVQQAVVSAPTTGCSCSGSLCCSRCCSGSSSQSSSSGRSTGDEAPLVAEPVLISSAIPLSSAIPASTSTVMAGVATPVVPVMDSLMGGVPQEVDDDDDDDRSRDENLFLAEGYRVLRKHFNMIIPSRVEGPCRFCLLAPRACNGCMEKFLTRLEGRCGRGDSAFERLERQLVERERLAFQQRVKPVKAPCVFCSLSQTMCGPCWQRFGSRELAS